MVAVDGKVDLPNVKKETLDRNAVPQANLNKATEDPHLDTFQALN